MARSETSGAIVADLVLALFSAERAALGFAVGRPRYGFKTVGSPGRWRVVTDDVQRESDAKEPATVTGNLLRAAAQATPKDLATMLLDQAKRNSDPLGVLWELGNVLTTDAKGLASLLDGVYAALPQGKPRQLLGMALNALRGRGVSPLDLAGASGQSAAANGTPAGAAA